MSWQNHNSALAYVARAMDSINEARTETARPTSENQMNSPNSKDTAALNQSDTLFPGVPLPSSKSRSNHRKTCVHAPSRSWQNLIRRALDYVVRAMEASLKYRQKRLDPSQNQIDTQNSTDKAAFTVVNQTCSSMNFQRHHQKGRSKLLSYLYACTVHAMAKPELGMRLCELLLTANKGSSTYLKTRWTVKKAQTKQHLISQTCSSLKRPLPSSKGRSNWNNLYQLKTS